MRQVILCTFKLFEGSSEKSHAERKFLKKLGLSYMVLDEAQQARALRGGAATGRDRPRAAAGPLSRRTWCVRGWSLAVATALAEPCAFRIWQIKNSESARYKNLTSVRTPHRLLLTGTPIENSPRELLALLWVGRAAQPHV